MWYGVMNKYIGNQGKITAIKKVAADQLLFAPVFLVALIALFGVVEGKTTSAINQQIAQDYVDVLINNYTVSTFV